MPKKKLKLKKSKKKKLVLKNKKRVSSPKDPMADSLLAVSLSVAVPFWIDRVSSYTPRMRKRRAEEVGDIVASQGDIILFKSKVKGETAEAFNALAEGIACLAYQPGGITIFGQHWCTGVKDADGKVCH